MLVALPVELLSLQDHLRKGLLQAPVIFAFLFGLLGLLKCACADLCYENLKEFVTVLSPHRIIFQKTL